MCIVLVAARVAMAYVVAAHAGNAYVDIMAYIGIMAYEDMACAGPCLWPVYLRASIIRSVGTKAVLARR